MSKRILLITSLLFLPTAIYAAATDYLILQDIGPYKLFTGIQGEVFSGPPSKYSQTATGGVLAAAGHFSEGDASHETSYTESSSKWPFIEVEVTRHMDSPDSLRWLLHEVDLEFRNYYGMPEYYIKNISGNTVYVYGAGGRDYRWLSGGKVVMIEYHDSQLTKPEPVEVITAYLAKHPSTLPAVTMNELNSVASKTTWIKDEMERRLWLCDKWFLQITLGKADEKQVYQESVKSMNIFLDYREKYYRIKAADEKNLLAGYLSANNGTGIKAKLTEYKNWWTVNKGGSIALP